MSFQESPTRRTGPKPATTVPGTLSATATPGSPIEQQCSGTGKQFSGPADGHADPVASSPSLTVRPTETSSGSKRNENTPRVNMKIEGETLPVLFDTGAEISAMPKKIMEKFVDCSTLNTYTRLTFGDTS